MVTYTKKLVTGSAFLLLMSIISAFLGYGIRIVLARNLTPSEYGLFYAVFAFVSFFLFFRDLGFSQALPKFIPESLVKKDYNKIKTTILAAFKWQLLSSVLFGLVLFVLSNFLAKNYFKDIAAATMLKIFIVYVFFSMIFLLMQAIFQSFQKNILFSVAEPLRNIVMLVLIFVLFNRGFSVFSPVWAFTFSWIIVSFILAPFLLKTFNIFRYKVREFAKTSSELFKFGFPVMISSIGYKIIARVDVLVLTYFVALDQVGIYNVILPSALLFLFLADSVSAIALPMISELWAKKDKQRLKDWISLIYRYSFVFLLPAVLVLFIFPDFFINLFFGKAYISGALAFQILLIGVLFFTVARLTITTLLGIGHPKTVTKMIWIATILNAVLNLILIPLFGIIGASITMAISYFTVFVLSIKELNKFVKTEIPVIPWIKSFAAGLVFVFVAFGVKKWLVLNPWGELIISFAVAGLVYVALLFLFKLVDINEMEKYATLIK